nr:MATH domain and coiled-coil domain-containing protein At3g58250-like [Ipomoea batatas]
MAVILGCGLKSITRPPKVKPTAIRSPPQITAPLPLLFYSTSDHLLIGDATINCPPPLPICTLKRLRTLSIYPNGDASRNSTGYISMFLCIEDTDELPKRWEIYTNLKFFIFDQNRDKYLIFQDDQVSRFHQLKPECGIKELISREVFDDAAHGLLVDDRCAFGVEVFVIDSKFSGECLSPSVKVDKTYTWRVYKFSHLGGDGTVHYSKEFDAESYKWKLAFYPRGNRKPYGKHLALHLELVDPEITSPRLLVHFELSVINQKSEKHIEAKGMYSFHYSMSCEYFDHQFPFWGWDEFALLNDLRDESNGFIVDNCLIIKAHIKTLSTIDS